MASNITVTADSLHTAAKNVRTVESDVQADLAMIRSLCVNDLGPAWKGPASGVFQQLMTDWDTNARNLMKALSAIADLLDRSATEHVANDENNQQALGRISAALSAKPTA